MEITRIGKIIILFIVWYILDNLLENITYLEKVRNIPVIGDRVYDGFNNSKSNIIILLIIIVSVSI